jgi:hypothetical protein
MAAEQEGLEIEPDMAFNRQDAKMRTKLRLDQTCLDSLCAFGATVLADGHQSLPKTEAAGHAHFRLSLPGL